MILSFPVAALPRSVLPSVSGSYRQVSGLSFYASRKLTWSTEIGLAEMVHVIPDAQTDAALRT
jgi:hypothetical protein